MTSASVAVAASPEGGRVWHETCLSLLENRVALPLDLDERLV